MLIDANTKIGVILREHPLALETIVSISPKFTKLRNPILRKVIASRTTIAMASRIGGCDVNEFFHRLSPLGFQIDAGAPVIDSVERDTVPGFILQLAPSRITALDVRPLIDRGSDPFSLIQQHISTLPNGQVLKIINNFEPTPLIKLLSKKGFAAAVRQVEDDLVETYFYKKDGEDISAECPVAKPPGDWDATLAKFRGRTETIDVRDLPMPQPMHAILEALEGLGRSRALLVFHKRVPVFLLPELQERGFRYLINESGEEAVQLIIFSNQS